MNDHYLRELANKTGVNYDNPELKIADVQTIMLRVPPLDQMCAWSEDAVLVKIITKGGVEGLGEADSSPLVVKSVIETPGSHETCMGLRALLLGENPLNIGFLWDKMYQSSFYMGRMGAGVHAISAIDIALWDLAGKIFDMPLYQILRGKKRESIKAYATFEPSENLVANKGLAKELVGQSYQSLKLGGGCLGNSEQLDLDVVSGVRAAVGEGVDLQIDLVGKWKTADMCLKMATYMAPFGLSWIEEPILAHDWEAYKELSERCEIPIAGGENLCTRWEFDRFLETSSIPIIQPDITRCGGISEMLKIYKLAQSYGAKIRPHGFSTGILTAATAHTLISLDGGDLIELSSSCSPLASDLVSGAPALKLGHISVSDAPGLGLTLNDCAVPHEICLPSDKLNEFGGTFHARTQKI